MTRSASGSATAASLITLLSRLVFTFPARTGHNN